MQSTLAARFAAFALAAWQERDKCPAGSLTYRHYDRIGLQWATSARSVRP